MLLKMLQSRLKASKAFLCWPLDRLSSLNRVGVFSVNLIYARTILTTFYMSHSQTSRESWVKNRDLKVLHECGSFETHCKG